ncbi:hypothetical protein [Amycolatopsis sp. FDAARGOS 1241]|uniref:hypothetical protein n=1 Tax=Amycolatopsis sp. FDAARGOS 1241 TaxID=2778070 RepID=UPI00194F9733|nr:hypothetical protein [Amycolatopsis sp. FDAARGOS 1241]QRP47883.1 hypothetical protein I6J71_08205 [Amycolatopsis sp. FDAARGOS 1241]
MPGTLASDPNPDPGLTCAVSPTAEVELAHVGTSAVLAASGEFDALTTRAYSTRCSGPSPKCRLCWCWI